MKQSLLTISLLFAIWISINSREKELPSESRTSVTGVESLKGFEVRLIPFPNGVFSTRFGYAVVKPICLSAYVGYFNEKRISSSWTLLSTVGLHNIATKSHVLRQNNDTLHGYYLSVGPDHRTTYLLKVEAGIEPRWYWGFKDRQQQGKAHLNSGWFLSFPLMFQTDILHTPEPLIKQGWFPSVLYSGTILFIPTVGFRQAISDRWFVEGSVGMASDILIAINSVDSHLSLSGPEFNPSFRLKAAYTLNH